MKLTDPSSIYSGAARSIVELRNLRNLRKVKLFPRVSTVTVVTYYRRPDELVDYQGTAHIFNFWQRKHQVVSLLHNIHAPPEHEADEVEVEAEEDIDPSPLPAIGYQYQPAI